MSLDITILGSGTSTGVPVIGCDCAICQNPDPSYHRLRSSILIKDTANQQTIIIDTTPDFRQQVLRAKVTKIDAVLYTHTHADHCHGFDDLRAFYFFHQQPIPCYLSSFDAKELRERFSYAFLDLGYSGTVPQVVLHEIMQKPFTVGGLTIEPLWLPHGNVQTVAFRIGGFAYATDFKGFSPEAIAQWKGKVKTMVASGLHFKTHPTHSTIPETCALFETLGVERGFITHLSHHVDYQTDNAKLPKNVFFAYDQMVINHVGSS